MHLILNRPVTSGHRGEQLLSEHRHITDIGVVDHGRAPSHRPFTPVPDKGSQGSKPLFSTDFGGLFITLCESHLHFASTENP
jgi:hypothetical protein